VRFCIDLLLLAPVGLLVVAAAGISVCVIRVLVKSGSADVALWVLVWLRLGLGDGYWLN